MAIGFKFLGTGGAFDFAQGNSSALVSIGGKTILLDCGHSVYTKLCQKGLVEEMDYVLITHLHDDHCGSLSTLLFHRHFLTPDRPLTLLYPDARFHALLHIYLSIAMQKPEQYFRYMPLKDFGGSNYGIGYLDTFGKHVPNMQTYAYAFAEDQETVIYSGDLGDAPYLFHLMEEQHLEPAIVYHDISFFPGVAAHAHYTALKPYKAYYNILGYHCNAAFSPPDNPIPLVANRPELLA